jgi:hypothetical protein
LEKTPPSTATFLLTSSPGVESSTSRTGCIARYAPLFSSGRPCMLECLT